MNKKWSLLSLGLVLCGTNAFCTTEFQEKINWTGLYLGGNAGYLWSANNIIDNLGVAANVNQNFLPNSLAIGRSLASLGTEHIFNSSKGFIGGGQIGYNALYSDHLVIGIETDLDGVAQSNGTSTEYRSVSTNLLGTHNATVTINKKLNYLGLVKGRIGALISPTLLIYGSGAFAYGGGSINTTYSVTQTNAVFLPMRDQANDSKVLAGWSAGAGMEWIFRPCWSVKLEYLYYNLGPLRNIIRLDQYLATTPQISYSGAIIESTARFTDNTLRLGVNYHFG